MRIQNNITAMNTHRMYTINNDNVAKAAEKLSSGYRINRAGDDAAGLAISEKMRSQIRGLNMATKNSQDAISLVQTAEGALQETHSMLQRMNELAVQAATGTNQDSDRLALAKEFEQLKREINDIAEQTTFNNMKVLDGSLSYSGYQRSVQTAGVNTTVEKLQDVSPMDPTSVVESVKGTDYTAAAPAEQLKIEIGGSQLTTATGTGTNANLGLAAGDKLSVEIDGIGKVDYTLVAADIGNAATNSVGAAVAAAINSQTNASGADFEGYTATWNAATSKLEVSGPSGTSITTTDFSKDGLNPKITVEKAAHEVGTGTTPPTTAAGNATEVKFTETAASTGIDTVSKKGETYTLTFTDTSTPAKTLGTVTVTGDGTSKISALFQKAEGELTNGEKFHLDTDPADSKSLIMTSQSMAGAASFLSGFTGAIHMNLTSSADKISVDSEVKTVTNGKEAVTEAGPKAAESKTYIEFDQTKANHIKDGDKLSINGNEYVFGKDFTDLQSLASAINAKDGSNVVASVAASDKGDVLKLTQAVDKAADTTQTTGEEAFDSFKKSDVSVNWTGAKGEGTKQTVEFDFAKIQDGDSFKITVGSKEFTVTKHAGQTRDDFMKQISDVVGKTYDDGIPNAKVNGSAIIATNTNITVEFANDALKDKDTNAVRIQVGALENEQLAVSIDAMNTKGLNLDDSNLDTQDSAGEAITAVRAAVEKVSDQRATLGAMQNRLDHKIANLKVSSENLSAAESRIRDVDMAEEMTNFTKNNILSQAATAMLAQANALPQNVLSLLG